MTIRAMRLSDFPEIYSLWEETKLPVQPYDVDRNEVRMMLKLNPNSCFVGIEDHKIIATIMGIFNGRRGWIYHLAVTPEHQKKGYGTILLQKVEEALKKVGATKIRLFVDNNNVKILPFYLKEGYTAMNEAIVLRKDLKK